VQLGFVIDHSRCIGCHACTVACKSENAVPLGSFRTWVKHTEEGAFPDVRRSFAVLRCNQCTHAPCVEICPVRALEKRPDGIVDVDPRACIGCKACMQGCPYDALYINESSGTAEKCHFCAHRVESGLAPACAVVCPTEAIVPGDLHDPDSVVGRMRTDMDLAVRKVEAGTGPNVLYREVAEAGIDPLRANAAAGYPWANQQDGDWLDAERFHATAEAAAPQARTTYDVDHAAPWGWRITAYLFAKSLAAGLFLVPALRLAGGGALTPAATGRAAKAALLFLLITGVLLVADLKRPDRFAYVLLWPNWRSWIARGSAVIALYGAFLTLWTAAGLLGAAAASGVTTSLYAIGAVLAALTACYTAWLFGQSKGRVLWMRRGLWLHLIVQAFLAGAALTMLLDSWLGSGARSLNLVRTGLLASLAAHALLIAIEPLLAPPSREAEYHRASRLLTRGPFAARRYAMGIVIGIVLPVALLAAPNTGGTWVLAAVLVLYGLYVEEDTLVRAGQAQTIS
jgi:Fe-S-cluster-containing dehydrogenase component/Ni/Fe-hydrogenase subunit HybB-like protein